VGHECLSYRYAHGVLLRMVSLSLDWARWMASTAAVDYDGVACLTQPLLKESNSAQYRAAVSGCVALGMLPPKITSFGALMSKTRTSERRGCLNTGVRGLLQARTTTRRKLTPLDVAPSDCLSLACPRTTQSARPLSGGETRLVSRIVQRCSPILSRSGDRPPHPTASRHQGG
jgi:hypothetical protein